MFKTITLLPIIALFLMTSCSTLLSGSRPWMNVEPGMTKQAVMSQMGEPKYRRFDHELEEWEYTKTTLDGDETIIIIGFDNGKVVNMNTFNGYRRPTHYPGTGAVTPAIPLPVVPPAYPAPVYPDHVMGNSEFQQLYQELKDATFKDKQMKLLASRIQNRYFNSAQCIRIMSLYTFDDDRMEVIRIMAPNIKDRENFENILDSLTFSSNKDKIRKEVFGRRER
ncbi:MAG: DUF4476 domain-containing protein [Bacteroidales bacterium]